MCFGLTLLPLFSFPSSFPLSLLHLPLLPFLLLPLSHRLEAVQTSEELSDVYTHFLLYYGRDLIAMQNRRSVGEEGGEKQKTTVKKALRRDFYSICQENGLGSLASKFGLTPEQFGENLRDNYQRHETEQHSIEPEEAAEDYVQHVG